MHTTFSTDDARFPLSSILYHRQPATRGVLKSKGSNRGRVCKLISAEVFYNMLLRRIYDWNLHLEMLWAPEIIMFLSLGYFLKLYYSGFKYLMLNALSLT